MWWISDWDINRPAGPSEMSYKKFYDIETENHRALREPIKM